MRKPAQRMLRLVVTVGAALTLSTPALAHGNERAEAQATVGTAKVTITYARPSLKGRDINKMIQPGQLWRLGADIPTTIESTGDLDFGGTRVPKGKYILLARLVEPGHWTLVLSTKSVNQYEPSAKVAEAPLELEQNQSAVEDLTINLTGQSGQGTLEIAWGAMRLRGSFVAAK